MPIVKANNINIYYKEAGQGEALIMLMGLGADHNAWKDQVPFLNRYFRVITPDNRGTGMSDKPREPYSMRMMADDTVALMTALEIEKAHILGLSMGGLIAQELAINYPKRVDKLVLASTYAVQDLSSGSTPEMMQASQVSGKAGLFLIKLAFNRPLQRYFMLLMAGINSLVVKDSVKAVNRAGFEGQLKACLEHNTLDRLSQIKARTLVIVGEGDRVIKPSSSEVMAEKIPDSNLVKFKNGSHVLNMEMKNFFDQTVLSFLTDGTNQAHRL